MSAIMDLSGLLLGLLQDPSFARATRAQGPEGGVVAPDAALPFLLAGLSRHRLVLAVTATTRQSEDLAAAASSLVGHSRVAVLPAWETLPHERLSPSSDTVGRRLAVLRRLAHPDPDDDTDRPAGARRRADPRAAAADRPGPGRAGAGARAGRHDHRARRAGRARSSAIGYAPTDLVEKRGQFATRGGIVDVFPPTEEHPLRVEFWGDDVEEIRYFRVTDQRSLEVARHGLWAPPCRELLLTGTVRARAAALADQHPELVDMAGRLAEGIVVEGMEALSPLLADGMETLVDAVARAAGDTRPMVLLCDPELVRTRAHDLVATSNEFLAASWHNAAAGNTTPIDLGSAAYRTIDEVRQVAGDRSVAWWTRRAVRHHRRRRRGRGPRPADHGHTGLPRGRRGPGQGPARCTGRWAPGGRGHGRARLGGPAGRAVRRRRPARQAGAGPDPLATGGRESSPSPRDASSTGSRRRAPACWW